MSYIKINKLRFPFENLSFISFVYNETWNNVLHALIIPSVSPRAGKPRSNGGSCGCVHALQQHISEVSHVDSVLSVFIELKMLL